jgi:hypothetical protein
VGFVDYNEDGPYDDWETRPKPFVHKHLGLAGQAGFDVSLYSATLYDNLTIL